MKISYKYIVSLAMAFLTLNESSAKETEALRQSIPSQREILTDSLSAALENAVGADDSIRLLYDLFDVSNKTNQVRFSKLLYETASRHDVKRYDVALDALRLYANLNIRNDSLLRVALNEARRLPDSPDQRETLAFINLTRSRGANMRMDEAQRLDTISKLSNFYVKYAPTDTYQEIQRLNELAVYLISTSGSHNVNVYLDRALALTDSIDFISGALKNATLTSLSLLNIMSNNSERTVKANRDLLKLIAELEAKYHANGRRFKQYNASRYTALRRILSQYDSLPVQTADSIYEEIHNLAAIDSDVESDLFRKPAAVAYWHMKHNRYALALPLLEKMYAANTKPYENLIYLPKIIEAAKKTGNTDVLLKYYPLYVENLESSLKANREANFNDFRIIYDFNALRKELATSRQSNLDDRAQFHRQTALYLAGGLAVLVIVVVWLLIMFIRKRKLGQRLIESSRLLEEEKKKLQSTQNEMILARDRATQADRHKTEFINNMSHEVMTPLDAIAEYSQLIVDVVDDKKKPYLQRYADIVRLNVDLITTIVGDVLEIGQLEDPKMRLKILPTDVAALINNAVGTVTPSVKPGVKIITEIPDADTLIVTDRHRVEQVLINLLHNAITFTEKGTVTIRESIDHDNHMITFEVTDTGIGIPPGKEQTIFERFEKLDPSTEGSGLGLTICAIIAQLLNGKVWAQEGRKSGARFYFSIPMTK